MIFYHVTINRDASLSAYQLFLTARHVGEYTVAVLCKPCAFQNAFDAGVWISLLAVLSHSYQTELWLVGTSCPQRQSAGQSTKWLVLPKVNELQF